jgi:hypothetical protein
LLRSIGDVVGLLLEGVVSASAEVVERLLDEAEDAPVERGIFIPSLQKQSSSETIEDLPTLVLPVEVLSSGLMRLEGRRDGLSRLTWTMVSISWACRRRALNPLRNKSWNCWKKSESNPFISSRYSLVNLNGDDSKLMLWPGDSVVARD